MVVAGWNETLVIRRTRRSIAFWNYDPEADKWSMTDNETASITRDGFQRRS